MTASRPYQVCLYAGPSVPEMDGVNVVDVTPAEPTADAVLDRLRGCGLAPADLRSRVLFVAETDARTAVLVYAALVGFAGRRLDVAPAADGEVVELADFDSAVRRLADAGRIEPAPDQVQAGAVAHPDLPSVLLAARPTPDQVSLVRYARRVRFVPPAATVDALVQLVTVAGLRARGDLDRMPYLVVGDEPVATGDGPHEPVGVCLNTLHRAAVDVRRSLRSDNRDSLAEPAELSDRQRHLLAAAELPIEETLARLGASASGEGEEQMWHCPRPGRHTHGDATASMRVVRGKVRCFRCDPERVDSLRLAMDTLAVGPDEAADWLLSGATLPALRPVA